jgi:hypothetical protein
MVNHQSNNLSQIAPIQLSSNKNQFLPGDETKENCDKEPPPPNPTSTHKDIWKSKHSETHEDVCHVEGTFQKGCIPCNTLVLFLLPFQFG